MEFVERIVSIRKTLEGNGYLDISNDILNAQIELGTPGEIFTKVCSILLTAKRNKNAYNLIHADAEWLLNLAKELGYHIIPK